jgi:hypothetical protein
MIEARTSMDWQLAIEKNREALKRILVMLVAMAGLPVLSGGTDISREKVDWRAAPTLPRHLHRFVLRLLRPAEAAARRLIIVAARGLVVELAPLRPRKPKPRSIYVRNGVGTGIVRIGSLPDRTLAASRPANLSLPLFDPLKRFAVRRKYVKPSAAPRIRSLYDTHAPLFRRPAEPKPPPLTPDDPLDAGRLHRRLEALASALDDLPCQAKRLARWRARRDARMNQDDSGGAHPTPALRADPPPRGEGDRLVVAARKDRPRRLFPMRPGRPPGWSRRPDHEVHEILNNLHGLAVWAMEQPDTS